MPNEAMTKIDEIMAESGLDIEKLAKAFNYLLERHIDIGRREQELKIALGDKEGLLKLQVQTATMEYVLGIFKFCYRQAKEKRVSDE